MNTEELKLEIGKVEEGAILILRPIGFHPAEWTMNLAKSARHIGKELGVKILVVNNDVDLFEVGARPLTSIFKEEECGSTASARDAT